MVDRDVKAIAVGYEDGDTAPVVLAKGKGKKAERILEIAEQFNLTLKKDQDLLQMLDVLDVGTYIPEKLFQTFALILAEIYKVDTNLAKEMVGE